MIYGIVTNSDSIGYTLLFGLLGVFALGYLTYQVYYFEVSDKFFITRNYNKLWFKKTYNLSKKITFKQPNRKPNAIRVTNIDGRSRLFMAGKLSDSQWVRLKERLEKQNVPIRDEFVDKIELVEFVFFDEIKEIFSRFKKNERPKTLIYCQCNQSKNR